ncbi:MAG: transglutaminase domain-containing protein [Beijerinckiaceae bacterium]
MIYDIAASIKYSYSSPSGGGRQVLRLLPATIPGTQRLVAGHLHIDPPPFERREAVDFFGTNCVSIAFNDEHNDVLFAMHARVERTATTAKLDVSPAVEKLPLDLAMCRDLGSSSPHHFTGPSPRIGHSAELTGYAKDVVRSGMSTVEAVHVLGLAIHNHMKFDGDATKTDTRPENAFRQGRGVCQDYSQITISCLRALGIPARYVSGYLRTLPPPGQPKLVGVDAMHAWVSAWCGADAGWWEYDPTNAVEANNDHIVVGYGRDYSDVAPVRGVSKLSGNQMSSHSVDVTLT